MVSVLDIKGNKISEMKLPSVFQTRVRRDLIKRAVVALQSHRLQPYGPNWLSGKNTSAISFGPGHALARIPRVSSGSLRGRGSIVPYAVGGRRAHPPVPERVLSKKINSKEKTLATASAIAATADVDLVKSRGHFVKEKIELPLIVADDLEKLKTAKEVTETLVNLGLEGDISRARVKTTRPGKGTKRGRRYKRKKSVLLVVSNKEDLKKAARNISGVDVSTAGELNAEQLAPGAEPARLTVYTVKALKDLDERFGGVL